MQNPITSLAFTDLEPLIFGAVSLEAADRGLVPWRLDHRERAFFQEPLERTANAAAGVHLRFCTEASALKLEFGQATLIGADDSAVWDLYVDGKLFARQTFPVGDDRVWEINDLPDASNDIVIYLPAAMRVCLRRQELNAGLAPRGARPRWVTHGSSITHCVSALGPGEAWPAIVAGAKGWDAWNLSFSGQCKIETAVARQIARQPADRISVCLGINVASNHYALRTWISAVEGFIMTIRDGHPDTPLLVISPILSPPREEWDAPPCKIGLRTMRRRLDESVRKFQTAGDANIFYLDGNQIIGPGDEHTMPDELHPDAEGIKLMGERFLQCMPADWVHQKALACISSRK